MLSNDYLQGLASGPSRPPAFLFRLAPMQSLISLPAGTVIKWAAVRLKALQDARTMAWEDAIKSDIHHRDRLRRVFFWLKPLTEDEAKHSLYHDIDRGNCGSPDSHLNYDISRVKEIMRLAGIAKTFGHGIVLLTEDDLRVLHAH